MTFSQSHYAASTSAIFFLDFYRDKRKATIATSFVSVLYNNQNCGEYEVSDCQQHKDVAESYNNAVT